MYEDWELRIQFVKAIIEGWVSAPVNVIDTLSREIVEQLDIEFDSYKKSYLASVLQEEERREKERKAYWRKFREGEDFGFITRPLDDNNQERKYGRFNGQLYYLVREGTHQFKLFYVDVVGREGKPTDPHILWGYSHAKREILLGHVKTGESNERSS